MLGLERGSEKLTSSRQEVLGSNTVSPGLLVVPVASGTPREGRDPLTCLPSPGLRPSSLPCGWIRSLGCSCLPSAHWGSEPLTSSLGTPAFLSLVQPVPAKCLLCTDAGWWGGESHIRKKQSWMQVIYNLLKGIKLLPKWCGYKA